MRFSRSLALFLCVFSGYASVASAGGGVHEPTVLYPGHLFNSVASYLASTVSVSGSSSRDDDRAHSSLGLVSDDLGWSRHRLGFSYRDTVSRRENLESSSLSFNYGLSLSKFDIGMEMENSDYAGVTEGNGNRFDAQSKRDVFRVKGSRPVAAWNGFAVRSLFSHATGSSSVADETGWEEDAQYQISKFGLEIREDHQLMAGLSSSTSVKAITGVNRRQTVNNHGESATSDQFSKVLVSASVSRAIDRWVLGVGGRYQFAPTELPSSEKFKVAGSSLASGFNGQARYATEGGWFRLQADSPTYRMPVLSGVKSSLQFSVLRGWTPGSEALNEPEGSASVGEVALQLDSRDFLASVSVGKMLSESDPQMRFARRPDVSLSIYFDL